MSTQPPTSYSGATTASSRLVSDQRRVAPVSAGSQLRFRFVVSDILYEARLRTERGSTALLVGAVVATMPYNAESPTARATLIALIAAAKDVQWGACGLSAKHRITVTGEVPITGPANSIILVSAALRFILQSGPFTRRVQEVLAQGATA